MKLIACKNTECKYFKKAKRCPAEDTCKGYTVVKPKRITCAQCAYCKRVVTHGGKQYHWECQYKGMERTILFVETRICDVKKEDFK